MSEVNTKSMTDKSGYFECVIEVIIEWYIDNWMNENYIYAYY